MLAKFLTLAATAPISSRLIPICPASSCSGLAPRSSKLQGMLADPLAAAAILNQLTMPSEAAQVKQQLIEARRKDPQAQLWPEVSADIIGSGHLREGEIEAIEVFQLNLLAYPDSADAHFDLADAYLKGRDQKDLARQYAEKALALLDSHTAPLSSWSDTTERRAEIRQGYKTLEEEAN